MNLTATASGWPVHQTKCSSLSLRVLCVRELRPEEATEVLAGGTGDVRLDSHFDGVAGGLSEAGFEGR